MSRHISFHFIIQISVEIFHLAVRRSWSMNSFGGFLQLRELVTWKTVRQDEKLYKLFKIIQKVFCRANIIPVSLSYRFTPYSNWNTECPAEGKPAFLIRVYFIQIDSKFHIPIYTHSPFQPSSITPVQTEIINMPRNTCLNSSQGSALTSEIWESAARNKNNMYW